MSRNETKKDLIFYLNDSRTAVVALKGLWGTGKTHLWDEVKTEIAPLNHNDHLYISCFGLDSIEQLKQALFQNSLGRAESITTGLSGVASTAIEGLEKIGAKLFPGLEGTSGLIGSLGGVVQSTLIEKMLRKRLIVIDDLERRGESLRIDSVMGFIDHLRRNECQVLVIFNDAPLTKKEFTDWRTLKEKCFDREVTLITTPEEAALIGLDNNLKTAYRQAITKSLIQAHITNIRVVQRIDRVVQTIFGNITDTYGDIAELMIPATVYLTALNYNAISNGPDTQKFIDGWREWCAHPSLKGKSEELTKLITFGIDLKLTNDFEFISLVWRHLQSGHRLKQEFENLFKARNEQSNLRVIRDSATEYIENIYLDPSMEDADFVTLAQRYLHGWKQLPAHQVSPIALDLEQRGASNLARKLIDAWAERWKSNPQRWASHLYPVDSLHPSMKETIENYNLEYISGPTLLESVLQVASGSWSPEHGIAINSASPADVLRTIRTLKKDNFGRFIYFYRNEITNPPQRSETDSGFSAGIQSFIDAIQRQFTEEPSTRLSALLHLHLDNVLQPPHGDPEQKEI